ncbi:hypothetical protein OG749_43460 [Streptomyces nojiriensis]|uniref:hypothetical protein n=1 Tax=Streptomyces nojiriensis TaxID=66374 RepID=UPI002E171DC6
MADGLWIFRRWQRDGVWSTILTGLQARADAAGLITWEVNVDSTICRAHQHAAGARRDSGAQKEPPGGDRTEPDDHGLARCPELDTAAGHVRDFGEILTDRLGSTLPTWIDAVDASQLPGLSGLALHALKPRSTPL